MEIVFFLRNQFISYEQRPAQFPQSIYTIFLSIRIFMCRCLCSCISESSSWSGQIGTSNSILFPVKIVGCNRLIDYYRCDLLQNQSHSIWLCGCEKDTSRRKTLSYTMLACTHTHSNVLKAHSTLWSQFISIEILRFDWRQQINTRTEPGTWTLQTHKSEFASFFSFLLLERERPYV